MSHRQRTVTTAADDRLPVSEAVLETVAEATARDATELAPLFRDIDPEALDGLFAPRSASGSRSLGITFEYGGCRVILERQNDGPIEVTVREKAV